jgi:hypothetical protein
MTSPEIPVKVTLDPTIYRTEVVNPARGYKPPWYLAAVRRSKDRDYVPTDVWNELP